MVGNLVKHGLDRLDEAYDAYQRLMSAYPQSAWTGPARLRAADIHAFQGDPVGAMEEFQRIRLDFPDGPEATEALARTSILYRLHVRPRGATYTVSQFDRTRRLARRVLAAMTDPAGNVVFATDRGVWSFNRGLRLPAGTRPRGLAAGRGGGRRGR